MYNLNHQIVDGIIYNLNHRSVEVEKGGKNRERSARRRLRTGGRRRGDALAGTAIGAHHRSASWWKILTAPRRKTDLWTGPFIFVTFSVQSLVFQPDFLSK